MKLVKEHINEKFEEESDPVEDMGIGIKKECDTLDDAIDQFKDFLNEITHR